VGAAGLLIAAALAQGPAAAAAGDPLRERQHGLDQARFPEAWTASTGADVVIAVLDTGVDTGHPDLQGRLVPGLDLVEPGTEPLDDNGHGTHVAGIAAAAPGNGTGIAGAAPDARVMPVRVLDAQGAGDAVTIAEGVRWAVDNGADVVNLSLGGSGLSARLLKGGQINAAIRYAHERGVVVVAAAGNEGNALRSYRFGVPVVVVNAVDAAGTPADFSNFGDARAVAAPGVDIVSTSPTAPSTLFGSDTSGYGTLSGTSMAAPFVAAQAALLLAQGRAADDVVRVIADTAVNPSGDPRLGSGVIDAAAAVATPVGGVGAAAVSPADTAGPAGAAQPPAATPAGSPTAAADARSTGVVPGSPWLPVAVLAALLLVGGVVTNAVTARRPRRRPAAGRRARSR
jgi:subtilisin family serine protease